MLSGNPTLRRLACKMPSVLAILNSIGDVHRVSEKDLSPDTLKQWCGKIECNRKQYTIDVYLITYDEVVEVVTNEKPSHFSWFRWLFWSRERKYWYRSIGKVLEGYGDRVDTFMMILVYDRGPNNIDRPKLTFYSLPEGRTMREFLNEYFEANRQKIPESGMAGVKDDKPSGAHGSGVLA